MTSPQTQGSFAGGSELPTVIGAQELLAQAARLGLVWRLRPATVIAGAMVTFDGDTTPVAAVSLIGALYPGARVMCIITPPDGTFIVGHNEGTIRPGTLVGLYTQETVQSTASGTFEPAEFNAEDSFDVLQAHSPTVNNSRFTPSVAGWYILDGSVAFASNSTGRRGTRWTKNGLAMGANQLWNSGTTGGMIFPAKPWAVYLNGQGDYVEMEIFQESGGALDTVVSAETTTHMRVVYGSSVQSTV